MSLPAEVTSYVGRVREGAELRRALGSSRLVTLTGPGGVGKTRIAVHVAHEVARAYRDGVVFAGLAELRDGASLPHLVADRLGLRDRSGRPVLDALVGYLRERRLLLVLDNCEHVVDACADLAAAVLADCQQVTLLATGRQSLGVAGEQVVPVGPLDGHGPDAVALFADRAGAVWPRFSVTEDNRADVVRLCARLDGLPLAIELAAARVRSLSPRQIADRIGDAPDLLATASRSAPERHRSLRAAIDWSYELCSPEERAAWARLAVFAGSFELDAAEQVCGAPMAHAVDGLVDKAVLVRDGDRLRMLEPLREYGLAQLSADEAAATARAHRDWIDRLTADADAEWLSERQLAWIARLRAEHANLRAAVDWSIGAPGEAGAALRVLSRVDEYWTVSGRAPEAHALLDRALAAAAPDDPDRSAALAACALHALWHSDTAAAEARLAELADSTDPRAARVKALAAMMAIEPGSVEWADAAATAFRERGDARRECHPLFVLGVGRAFQGDLAGGREVLGRLTGLSAASGEVYYGTMAQFGTAFVEVIFGDIEAAADAARRGLRGVVLTDDRLGFGYQLEGNAWVAAGQGDHQRAAVLFGIADRAWTEVGATPDIAVSLPHKRYAKLARTGLGDAEFDRLWERGKAMPLDNGLRYALGEESASPTAPEHPLSRREAEIALLVADGLTNREIAARLVIAPRTADTHVQHILGKLGFTKRTQIAAWVAGGALSAPVGPAPGR